MMKKLITVGALLGLVLVIPIAFSVVLTDGVQSYCEIANKSSTPCTEIVGPVWWQMFAVHFIILIPIVAVVIVAPLVVLGFLVWFFVSVIRAAFCRNLHPQGTDKRSLNVGHRTQSGFASDNLCQL